MNGPTNVLMHERMNGLESERMDERRNGRIDK